MLQIRATQNKDSYKELIKSLSLDYEKAMVVEAFDREIVIGMGVYSVSDDNKKVFIHHIDSRGDLYLYDGIVRSILFLCMNKSINCAEFKFFDENLLRLKFIENNDNCIKSITDFMNNCKNCKNN